MRIEDARPSGKRLIPRPLGLLIAKMIIHLSFHHFFDGATEKVFQGILNVYLKFDIVLLKALTNNLSFSFCHNRFVNRSLSCHIKDLL